MWHAPWPSVAVRGRACPCVAVRGRAWPCVRPGPPTVAIPAAIFCHAHAPIGHPQLLMPLCAMTYRASLTKDDSYCGQFGGVCTGGSLADAKDRRQARRSRNAHTDTHVLHAAHVAPHCTPHVCRLPSAGLLCTCVLCCLASTSQASNALTWHTGH